MALASYSDLKTSIANWLNRSDLTTEIANDFIVLAEADLNSKLRVRKMNTFNFYYNRFRNRIFTYRFFTSKRFFYYIRWN
jgi:hypothetical protein